jgi:prepilin-type N-terminal cleavage/methylation domain-containing protein
MTSVCRTRQAGFNLVETMVASVILSGAVLALGAISSNAVRDVSLNRRYEVAASVIERQLSLIDCAGIDQFIELGQTEGVYEDMEPACHWQVETEYWGIDGLYLVTVTVTWLEGKRPRQLTAQTMLNGTAATIAVPLEVQ